MNAALSYLLILFVSAPYEAPLAQMTLAEQDKQKIIKALPTRASVTPTRPRRQMIFNRHGHDDKLGATSGDPTR